MLVRLLLGILKGLIVGGLLGFGLAKLGFAAPGAIIAFIAAALAGALVGLIAGKPIWAKDARIEAGMKAAVGALLGAGLMFVLRRWVMVPLPFDLGALASANTSLGQAAGQAATIGGSAITSLALIAAVLGGFYDADNTPESPEAKAQKEKAAASSGKRIGAEAELGLDDEGESESRDVENKRTKR